MPTIPTLMESFNHSAQKFHTAVVNFEERQVQIFSLLQHCIDRFLCLTAAEYA
jgi:hypothetical protein